jgi:phosphoserine phosphatase RsbU/P
VRLTPRSASPRGVVACLTLTAVIVLADLAHGTEKTQYVGLLASVPFLAATFARPWGVVGLGLVAWLAGGLIGILHDDGSGTPQWIRLTAIALATALAAIAGHSRGRREERLVAVQSAADAASRAILRPLPGTMSGVPVSVDYLSASEQARIGGDLYEAVETPYGLRMVIGDVRGKGLDAVRLAALTLGSFREAAHRETQLRDVASAMHAAVLRDAESEDFVTALLVEIRDDGVRMVSCGHPPPLVIRDGAAHEHLLPGHPPLGLGEPPPAMEVPVRPGDRVLLYTDGAVEARRAGEFFGLVDEASSALGQGDLAEGVRELSRRVHAFSGEGPPDDVAFLAFEMPGRDAVLPLPR